MGTAPISSDAGDAGKGGKGFSLYFVDVYARAGPRPPLNCGGSTETPSEPIYLQKGASWEKKLLTDIQPANKLARWSFSATAKEPIIKCVATGPTPFAAHLEIFAPTGKLAPADIRCAEKMEAQSVVATYDIKEDKMDSVCKTQ